MDAEGFDRMTQTFAARASRRGLMRGLAALGVSAGVIGPSRAAARQAPSGASRSGAISERTDAGCHDNRAISNTSCVTIGCVKSGCVCVVSAKGDKKCVNFGGSVVCPTVDECNRNRDCATGEVCVKVGGCCGGQKFNQCVPHCV